MRTLFEGSDVRVEAAFLHSDAAPVAITFSSFNLAMLAPAPFARPYVERLGFNAVYVIATRNQWWQTLEMVPAIQSVREHLAKRSSERVLYGSSMRGYGALQFARDLGATRIVAASPQTEVTKASKTSFRRSWADCMANVPILRDDIPDSLTSEMDIRIVVDPQYRLDFAHVRYLEARLQSGEAKVARYLAPFATHKVLGYLKEIGALDVVISGLLRGTLSLVPRG